MQQRWAGAALVFLLGVSIGWHVHTVQAKHDVWQAVVTQRADQARSLYFAYRRQPTRTRLALYVRAALNLRDALSVARYPFGDDPHRFEPSPEVVRMLLELDEASHTPAERQEWERLQRLAYNSP